MCSTSRLQDEELNSDARHILNEVNSFLASGHWEGAGPGGHIQLRNAGLLHETRIVSLAQRQGEGISG